MQNKLQIVRRAIAHLPALFLLAAIAHGQSSLFNIPTTDVLEKGSTYVEADIDTNLYRPAADRWQIYGAMAIRGVGRRTEIGVNVYAVRTAYGSEPVELQPNFKFSVYSSEKNGVAISAGAIGYLPVTKRIHRYSSVSLYAVASKTFSNNRAPRLTGGGYQLLGRNTDNTATRGFLIGIEQPIAKRLTLIADWNTAKNRFGYAAAGFGLEITKRSSLYSAYYFGNTGRGNNSLGIYYGLSF